MFVTCPFCHKIFSIQTKIENYSIVDCPLCETAFELNLNGVVVMDNGVTWIKSELVEDIYIGGFYEGVKYDEYKETINDIEQLLGEITYESEGSEDPR